MSLTAACAVLGLTGSAQAAPTAQAAGTDICVEVSTPSAGILGDLNEPPIMVYPDC